MLSGRCPSRREPGNFRSSPPKLEATRSEDLTHTSTSHAFVAGLRPTVLLCEGPGIVGVAPQGLLAWHPSSDSRWASRFSPGALVVLCTVPDLLFVAQPYEGVIPGFVEMHTVTY